MGRDLARRYLILIQCAYLGIGFDLSNLRRKIGGKMKKLILSIALLMGFSSANSEVIEQGKGVLFGNDHVFSATAAKGWVLDNASGVSQGLHMVFYPKGETWAKSSVIVYGKTALAKTIEQQVSDTIQQFHTSGSPNYKGEKKEEFKLADGKVAEVYHYSGDQWGNYEAAAYIKEIDTINFLIFNSRTEANFTKNIDSFYQIVKSYKNLYTPETEASKEKVERFNKESDQITKTKEGKAYERKAIMAAKGKLNAAFSGCLSYFPKEQKIPSFTYYAHIDNGGSLIDSLGHPVTTFGNCFSGVMVDVQYPKHELKKFILNVKLKIE